LITATWLAYGLSVTDPDSELHKYVTAVISSFSLHEFGWQTSRIIPTWPPQIEGKLMTFDQRLRQYIDKAKEHEHDLRGSLVMMIGFVYLRTRDYPDDLGHKWV
jgi:hypothetical protein